MIALDEDALICDLAETYQIYEFRAVPVKLIATLASGLGVNSRIKQKIRNEKASLDVMLLMSLIDHLKILIWQNTEDGRKGINFPESILNQLFDPEQNELIHSFNSGEEFEEMRQRIIEEVNRNGQ